MAKWFVRAGERMSGPFAEQRVRDLISSRQLDSKAYVRREDADKWEPIFNAFSSELADVPYVPPSTFVPDSGEQSSPPRSALESIWRVIFIGAIVLISIVAFVAAPDAFVLIAIVVGIFVFLARIERNTRKRR